MHKRQLAAIHIDRHMARPSMTTLILHNAQHVRTQRGAMRVEGLAVYVDEIIHSISMDTN